MERYIQFDVTDHASIKIIHQACLNSTGTVTLGFACQPFSKHMLQPQTAILERVIPASERDEVQQLVEQLASMMDWDLLQVNLHLQDRWPCRRSRWWVLLLPKSWNCLGLGLAPSTQFKHSG